MKVHKKDIERFEKTVNKLRKIMDDIKAYKDDVELVCFPTMQSLNIIINNGEEDLYDCEIVSSVHIDCNSCS